MRGNVDVYHIRPARMLCRNTKIMTAGTTTYVSKQLRMSAGTSMDAYFSHELLESEQYHTGFPSAKISFLVQSSFSGSKAQIPNIKDKFLKYKTIWFFKFALRANFNKRTHLNKGQACRFGCCCGCYCLFFVFLLACGLLLLLEPRCV